MPDPDLPRIDSLARLAELITDDVFLRFSRGPEHDRGRRSTDYESGLELPGLSVNRLAPEPWWTRPLEEWLARQICNYVHLRDQADDDRRPWVLRGEVVARGPDDEPLVGRFQPLAWLSDELVDAAKALYAERFDAGEDST